jgi:hypothetical protein
MSVVCIGFPGKNTKANLTFAWLRYADYQFAQLSVDLFGGSHSNIQGMGTQ